MSEFKDQIEGLLDDIQASLKSGSAETVRYFAERRAVIAAAIAADAADRDVVVKQELENMKLYATTQAVQKADKIDDAVWAGILKSFAACDTLILAALT